MKTKNVLKIPQVFRALLVAAVAILGAGGLQAQNFFDNSISGINLGNASGGSTGGHKSWAIFALSGGVTITDPSLDGSYDVLGGVAVGGSGVLTLSASRIKGDVNRETGGFVTSGGGNNTGFSNTVGGTNGSYVNTGVANAISASSTAAGLSRQTTGLSISGGVTAGVLSNDTTAISLSGAGGISDGGVAGTYVLNVADLILGGASAILTLNGTSSTNYVINVNRYMSLSTQAQIALSGGLTAANVLFNVKNTNPSYDVTLSGGSQVNGIIMAPTRNVKLTGGSVVYGEVIAKGVSLSGRSKVINPFVSP